MRVRCRYAKAGKPRFVSAIDLGRIWERALRKARLPIAYSEGFTPHPKVSFPDALPLGYASTGEYVELAFAVPVGCEIVTERLNEAFPDGLEVLSSVEVADGDPRLSRWLQASLWDLAYPPEVDPQALAVAVERLLDADHLAVGRERKGEVVEIDLRPAIHTAVAEGATVAAVLHHVQVPVRPSEVHAALQDSYPNGPHGGARIPEPALVTRVAQGTATDAGLREALTGAGLPVAPHSRTFERTAAS